MKEAKKFTMGLGDKEGVKNIGPKINREAVDAWLSKFPKNEGVDSSAKKGNRLKNETPSSVKEQRIAEATKDLEDTYPPEEVKEETPVITEDTSINIAEAKKNGVLHSIKGNLKKLGITLGLLSTASVAIGQQGPNANEKADQAFVNTSKNKIEYTKTNNEEKPDISKARKVSVIPEGYKKYKEGNKTIGVKINEGKRAPLEKAKPGSIKGDNSNYIISMLKKGYTVEELAEAGAGTIEGIEKNYGQ